jgi:hypothetical protein
MRPIILALACALCVQAASAADPVEGLLFINGNAYTMADFKGSHVGIVYVSKSVALGQC